MKGSLCGVLAMISLTGVGLASLGRAADDKGEKKVDTRVFEMRTYYAAPGKMDALHARFRNHTNKLFVKHGMTVIGFWSPLDPEQAKLKMCTSSPSQSGGGRQIVEGVPKTRIGKR